MSNQNLKYLVAFNQVISIGPVRLQRLLDYFPDPEKAWQASADELEKAGLEPKVLNEMIYKRKEIDPDQE
ncbi:DNA-protecting protein DprA, partial [Candidatus Falkowbacteria bacterium]|nr:DNA-protecting protein DprA [Candidatus Falkowbacteria bacterium]